MTYPGQKIWIIGASTGIGAATAREMAARGASVAVSARSVDKLTALVDSLPGKGHSALACDVTDLAGLRHAAETLAAAWGHIDRVILFSALYKPMSVDALDLDATRRIIDVNLMGAFHVAAVVLPLLRRQGRGQFALCGSVAGYRGLPNAQPYAATKAAVINLAETLRLEEAPRGIDIRVINPGFVKTPMTDMNTFDMPMIVTPEEAARSIADQLDGEGFEVHFPKKFTVIMKVLRLLPDWLYFRLAARFS